MILYFELNLRSEIKARAVSFRLSGWTIMSILSIHESKRSPNNFSG
jgi:hypothetical protein